ncbi:MAG TPA: Dyp-type peroxidase [Chitinophagales bacterium]|nr:Dyp-type peroxidase [Chitinophagales bacterium]HNL05959.1 Dyp-type peroxidase [Chitinophagales bacterium]
MVLLSQKAIDPANPELDDFLSQLQGNILKGHGRQYATHIFVAFMPNKVRKTRAYLQQFADQITSCKQQLHDAEVYRRNGVSGGTFYSCYLSASGYGYLGYNCDEFKDTAFKKGMKQASLNDPAVTTWDHGYQATIHACFLLADNDLLKLNAATNNLIGELAGRKEGNNRAEKIQEASIATILAVEHGNKLYNKKGENIEHFGYVDGISQPLFFKDQIAAYKSNNLHPLLHTPEAELEVALVKDPFVSIRDADAFGSYLVFRKLEQNVRGFKMAEAQLADQLKYRNEQQEQVGAMLIGRFEDGTPITLSEENGMIGSAVINNFNYQKDTGNKCPFHAHIRKTNPRTNEQQTENHQHLIVRRGIPYGNQYILPEFAQDSFEQLPQNNVGLLFLCFQKSITQQFEYIQQLANDPHFPQTDTGIDPIIGQDGLQNISKCLFPNKYAGKERKAANFDSFVTMKGGEYFFAPSIAFFKKLL